MTEVFGITDPELEAIRSVERYIATSIPLKQPFSPPPPVQDDLATVNRMLSRLATAPPIEEVASRPGDWAKDMAPPAKEVARGPSVVDRGSREIELRWAKETIGLVAVELNEAYAQFDITRDNGSIPSGALNQASRRLEEAMQHLGLTDEIPF